MSVSSALGRGLSVAVMVIACTDFAFERQPDLASAAAAAGGPAAASGGVASGGGVPGGGVPGGGAPGAGGAPEWELARTPPMGWNSWNRFGRAVDEARVRQIADAMVSSGMRDAGYVYVIVDDTWQAPTRDASGSPRADVNRFPSGMQALADYVHGHGLLFGLYSDRGTRTCAGLPGSYGHEAQDAAAYAEWGVDYLKYDNCQVPAGREGSEAMREDFTLMRDALRATGRPIVYSICAWWFYDWMPSVGHLWRTTTDIRDGWDDNMLTLVERNGGWLGRYAQAAYPEPGLARHAGPGGWNDPDMLEVGNGGMTDVEYQSHFSLWAMMAAPLIAGNDLRDMSESTRAILMNTEIIAVDRDALGKQGVPISESTELEVWHKPLLGGAHAVLLLNRTDSPADIGVTWRDLGIEGPAGVRDLWMHQDLGTISDAYTARAVPAHGSVVLRVSAP